MKDQTRFKEKWTTHDNYPVRRKIIDSEAIIL